MRIGTNELLIILVVVLLIFGPKNLPKLGKMFGKTMKNFKEGMDDVDENGDAKPAETKTEEKAEKKDADRTSERAAEPADHLRGGVCSGRDRLPGNFG